MMNSNSKTMMDKSQKIVEVHLTQKGCRLIIGLDEKTLDKMNEIRERHPIRYYHREFDLLNEAERQLKGEKQLNSKKWYLCCCSFLRKVFARK